MKNTKSLKNHKNSPKFAEFTWTNILSILSIMCIFKWIPQFIESLWKCTLWKIWGKYFVHIVHNVNIHMNCKITEFIWKYTLCTLCTLWTIWTIYIRIPKFEESIWKWTISTKYFPFWFHYFWRNLVIFEGILMFSSI